MSKEFGGFGAGVNEVCDCDSGFGGLFVEFEG